MFFVVLRVAIPTIMRHAIHRRFPAKLTLLAAILGITAASAQSHGITARTPIGAYLNNRLPAANPGGGGTWGTVNAFPNLTFQSPVKMIPQPGSNRLWVIGREGHVYNFVNDAATTARTLALDLSAQTQGWGDCGVVGIAFHPEFGQAVSPNRHFVYLYYNFTPAPRTNLEPTNVASYNRLSRFILGAGATTIDPASEYVLINQFDEHAWHNGGDMYFGADGFLYLTNGDEGGASDQYNVAQKIDGGLFSGVLRIDVDRNATRSHAIRRQPQVGGTPPAGWPGTYSQGYFIPNDNPWQDAGGSMLEEFWAIGLRSPHRMSFDPVSGKTFIGDIGQNTQEEVSVLVKGANFQWPYREGAANGPKAQPNALRGANTPPLWAYGRSAGHTCVIGGYVYRGAAHAAEIGGKYIFGDHASGIIWAMNWDQATPTITQLTNVATGNKWQGLAGFGFDQSSELYLMTLGTAGRVLKLTRNNANPQPPATLSATGAFAHLATLTPAAGLIPYDVNSPLWSDGAAKRRWIALPNDGAPYTAAETIAFNATNAWQFPAGTVFIKHFELPIDARDPTLVRRLETRFLVRDSSGGVYGITYQWRADQTDADLLASDLNEAVTVTNYDGSTRVQTWSYPSRENCQTCHNASAGLVLGPKTAQLNGNFLYAASGVTDNQLRTWSAIGMFANPPAESGLSALLKMVAVGDTTAPLETRARSYLDANCAHCHRPGGVRANWDGRFEMPLGSQGIVNGLVNDTLGILGAKVVAPGQIPQSTAHLRLAALDNTKMPPLAKNVAHGEAVNVLGQWIAALSGAALPLPWSTLDVGAPGQAGGSSQAAGVFTVSGGGADISDHADQFHYVWQPLTGDGEIVARVASQTNTDAWAKAGVMFRETLDAGSRHALLALAPGHGMAFEHRATTGGASLQITAPNHAAPHHWVRLVRSGNVFTAYTSATGSSWTQAGTATIAMAGTIQVGLAVTARNNSAVSTATFDNVQVTASAPLPGIALVLPSGATYTEPGSIALMANVSENQNAISKVQFMNGGVVLGESTSAPYLYTWTNVAAGSYALAVRVFTATGTKADSDPVVVTVNPPPTSGLPAVWTGQDLGAPGLAGSADHAVGVFTVSGGGANMGNGSDQFRYVWQQFTGNGEIIARVISQTNTNPSARAGVMFRETLAANSRHAMMVLTPGKGSAFQYRALTGGSSVTAASTSNSWLRLIRNDNLFAAYRSTNGTTWTQVGSATISMATVINVGLVVNANNNAALSTVKFDNVQIKSATLPALWTGRDIGTPKFTELEKFADGIFSIAGGGAEISGKSDQFHYVGQSLTGNGEIIARVNSQTNTNSNARAGVMFRESFNPNARNVAMLLTPGNGYAFQSRSSTGGNTTRTSASRYTAPNNWVRLVRSDNTFTGYRSTDGTTWSQIRAVTISMPATIYVGFAVTARNNNQLSTAIFDNVTITPDTAPP